jgi:SPP1 family predicted phage head-tail adaptor
MGRLTAGELKERVTILERSVSGGKVGEQTVTFAAGDTVWAYVGPVKYMKAAVYRGANLDADFEVKIRHRPELTGAEQIRYGGLDYRIVHLIHDDEGFSTMMLVKRVK